MYSVYGDGICIYNDLHLAGTVNALTPKLNLADNTAGSLEITLPVGNAGYDKLECLGSEIVVKRFDEEIWAGRIISEKKNFQNSRILTCEGELAYLNDTAQEPREFTETEVYDFLEEILMFHNENINKFTLQDRRLEMGAITVDGIITCVLNNESTLETINKQLIEKFGGHIRIRRVYDENGKLHRYFDYLIDYPNTNAQEIRFGENLLDFTSDWDMSEYATVLVPQGAKLDESPIESIDAYLDVSSVNGGSRYVTSEPAIKKYGWIEKLVSWDDITDPSELLQKAKDYLANEQFDNIDMVIEVSAVDLRYLSKDVQPINLLDSVRCISRPHGMDKVFPVTELSIQLDCPENSTYTLGGKTKKVSLTASTKEANDEIIKKIDEMPKEETILDKARDNATSILNMTTQGYVTVIKNNEGSQSLVVSSENANTAYNPETDTWKNDVKLWKWNINGLGYSKDGGRNYGTAITMDGSIVANYITTGTMSADRIRTGTIVDQNGNTKWDLNEGILTMKRGSITLGITDNNPEGLFSVTDTGYLTAKYGIIGGFRIDSGSIFNDMMNLNSYGLNFYSVKVVDDQKEYTLLGNYGTQYWENNPDTYGLAVNMECDAGYIVWSRKDNASDKSYTMKLMYTAKDLIIDKDEIDKDVYNIYTANRLHLGTWLQTNNYGFKHNLFSGEYTSISVNTYTNHGAAPSPLRLVADLSLGSGGSVASFRTVNCFIVNGIISKKEGFVFT